MAGRSARSRGHYLPARGTRRLAGFRREVGVDRRTARDLRRTAGHPGHRSLPRPRADNLEHLADALREVRAELRGADPDLPLQLDGKTLAHGDAFTFTTLTSAGLTSSPRSAGVTGYDDLARDGATHSIVGHRVLCIPRRSMASNDDGRPKDLLARSSAALDELDDHRDQANRSTYSRVRSGDSPNEGGSRVGGHRPHTSSAGRGICKLPGWVENS